MNRFWRWLDDENWWGVCAIVLSIFQLGQAVVLNRWTIEGFPRPSLAAAVAGLVFGMAVFRRLPWARWVGVVWIGFLLVVALINLATFGLSIGRVVFLAAIVLAGAGVYVEFFHRRRLQAEADGDGRPFLSLVLLLREPRFLDATIVASLATRAWGVEIVPSRSEDESDEGGENGDREDDGTGMIMGEPPLFLGMHPHAIFAVHVLPDPYFDDPETTAEAMIEMRARHAIEQHKAWIAVDVVHWHGPGEATEGAYRLIARLLAELADDNVLAVVDPEAGQIFCYDPETERKLQSENPLAELREGYYVPVIGISDDDPLMQAAIAEARQRWPEFVAAFESRDLTAEDNHYAVKARFGSGDNVEHMWVQVTAIENDVVYGRLDNDPANMPELAAGDTVRFPRSDISDWMYVVNEEVSGGFSLKVIAQRTKEAKEARESAQDP